MQIEPRAIERERQRATRAVHLQVEGDIHWLAPRAIGLAARHHDGVVELALASVGQRLAIARQHRPKIVETIIERAAYIPHHKVYWRLLSELCNANSRRLMLPVVLVPITAAPGANRIFEPLIGVQSPIQLVVHKIGVA